jgi:hypothetical protein
VEPSYKASTRLFSTRDGQVKRCGEVIVTSVISIEECKDIRGYEDPGCCRYAREFNDLGRLKSRKSGIRM